MESNGESRNLQQLRDHPSLVGDSWYYFKNFLGKLSPNTQENYLREFTQFLEFRNQTTDQFFDQFRSWVRDEDERKKLRLGIEVTEYQKQLMQERGVKGASVMSVHRAVMGFLTANGLGKEFQINGERITDDSDELPNISKEQLNQILEATGSYRIKAVIHLAKDSGLRIGDVTRLKVEDVRPIWDDPNVEQVREYPGFYQFDVVQGKTGNPAYPVIGYEAIESLQKWKAERADLEISDNDSDPLFCAIKTVTPFTDKRGRYVKGSTKGWELDESTLSVIFSKLVRKSKVKKLRGEKRKPSIHSLRKYHKTNLEYAGLPTSWINKLQGRKGEGTGGTYTKPSIDQLIDLYSKAYHGLAISESEKVINGFKSELEEFKENLRITEMSADYNKSVADELQERLEAKDREIEKLKTDFEELRSLMLQVVQSEKERRKGETQ